jgi:hypothetical protein
VIVVKVMMFVGIAVSCMIKIWNNSGMNSSEELHDAAFLIKFCGW